MESINSIFKTCSFRFVFFTLTSVILDIQMPASRGLSCLVLTRASSYPDCQLANISISSDINTLKFIADYLPNNTEIS